MKKIARSWISGADRLGMQAGAVSVKACGKDAAAVQDQQVARTEQVGKVNEFSIFKVAGETREMQQTRTAAIGKGLLRDQFFWKMKIKVRNQHPVDYRTCRSKLSGASDARRSIGGTGEINVDPK
jgi:hypothetical protein